MLYQFPISHFCEKARWALEYKQLQYKKINLLPGLHAKKAKKLTGKSSLPILVDNKKVINESSEIISFLDIAYPNKLLTPENSKLKKQALEWEKFADKELGPNVRRLCYNTLLDHADITIPFFTTGGPWYGKFILKRIFPKMSIKMREFMKLDKENIIQIKQHLRLSIDKLHDHTKNNNFLVGDSFTRADLAVASLLAPLFRPDKYGLDWPEQYPDPLHSTICEFGNKLSWAQQIYNQYR